MITIVILHSSFFSSMLQIHLFRFAKTTRVLAHSAARMFCVVFFFLKSFMMVTVVIFTYNKI